MTVRRAIIFLAVGQTIFWAGLYYIFAALLIRWEAAEAWSKTSLTLAFTGAIIMAALFAPVAGRLVDKGNGPSVLAGSALVGAGMVSLLPLAPNAWVFGLIWIGIGTCLGACLYETCFAFVTRTQGDNARRSITLITLFAGFAGTISFPVCHAITEAFGWHYAVWTLAGLVAFVGVPLVWTAAKFLEASYGVAEAAAKAAGEEDTTPANPVPLLRRPVFWLIAIGFALLGANHGIVLNHLLPILHDRGLSSDAAVLAASMIGPMQVAGRLAMMASEKNVSSHGIATACFVAVGVATACLLFADAVPLLIVGFVILQGSGHGVSSIMRPVIVREVLGARRFGVKSASVAVPYLMMWALSPFIGALIWEAGGYDLVLMTVGVFAVTGLISYRMAARISR